MTFRIVSGKIELFENIVLVVKKILTDLSYMSKYVIKLTLQNSITIYIEENKKFCHRRNMGRNIQREVRETATKCICPICRKEHNRMIKWMGRGTPRKYCKDCMDNNIITCSGFAERFVDRQTTGNQRQKMG